MTQSDGYFSARSAVLFHCLARLCPLSVITPRFISESMALANGLPPPSLAAILNCIIWQQFAVLCICSGAIKYTAQISTVNCSWSLRTLAMLRQWPLLQLDSLIT